MGRCWFWLGFAAGLVAAGPVAAAAEFTLIASSDTSFSRPHDLALSPDGNLLYVADVGNDAVKVLDPMSLEVVGAIGAGVLSAPHDVAFDWAGRLWVADSGNDRLVLFLVVDAEAVILAQWPGLPSPEGVVAGPDGRAYATSAADHGVVAIIGRSVVDQVAGRGRGPGEFIRPHDIDVAADGTIYVVDPGNNRIQLLDANLDFVGELRGPPFDFNEPKYIAFDDAGWLYVADEYNDQIKVFDESRAPVGVIGTGERGNGPGQLDRPEGVTVRGDHVWVSDTHNHRILLFKR